MPATQKPCRDCSHRWNQPPGIELLGQQWQVLSHFAASIIVGALSFLAGAILNAAAQNIAMLVIARSKVQEKSSRKQENNNNDGGVATRMGNVKSAPKKKWEEMTLNEKAVELYMGEKGALFWLNKFAYASIFIMIGAWILFRFVGPALNLYQLDSQPLNPSDVFKGS
ncbi:hypothetical protein AHAS_Ahas04G0213200 [Arachis hypogaea]